MGFGDWKEEIPLIKANGGWPARETWTDLEAAQQTQTKALIAFYMKNAAIIHRELSAAGQAVYGSEQGPYVSIKTPAGVDSLIFVDLLRIQAALAT